MLDGRPSYQSTHALQARPQLPDRTASNREFKMIQMHKATTAFAVASTLLLALPLASSQHIQTLHPAYYQVHAWPPRHSAPWLDMMAEFDTLFASAFDSRPAACTPTVQLREQLKTDENNTAHLFLSVVQHQPCHDDEAVDISDVDVSVLEQVLTVSGNTTHGGFLRSYRLPEHSLPTKITAMVTHDKILHIECPVDPPPPPQPITIGVTVDTPPAASSPLAAGDAKGDQTEQTQISNSTAANVQVPAQEKREPAGLDLELYIKKMEADLARLKGLM